MISLGPFIIHRWTKIWSIDLLLPKQLLDTYCSKQWTEQKKKNPLPLQSLHSSVERDNKPTHPTDKIMLVVGALKKKKRLVEVGEIRQSGQGAVKRKNWVDTRGWGAETSWWMGRSAPEERRARAGSVLGTQRDCWPPCLEGSHLEVGGRGSREVAASQTLWGPVNRSQDWILVQVCEGKPLESCEYEGTFSKCHLSNSKHWAGTLVRFWTTYHCGMATVIKTAESAFLTSRMWAKVSPNLTEGVSALPEALVLLFNPSNNSKELNVKMHFFLVILEFIYIYMAS